MASELIFNFLIQFLFSDTSKIDLKNQFSISISIFYFFIKLKMEWTKWARTHCEFSSRFHSDSKRIRSGFVSKRRESPRIHNVFARNSMASRILVSFSQ